MSSDNRYYSIDVKTSVWQGAVTAKDGMTVTKAKWAEKETHLSLSRTTRVRQ